MYKRFLARTMTAAVITFAASSALSTPTAFGAANDLKSNPYNATVGMAFPDRVGGLNSLNQGYGYTKICNYHKVCDTYAIDYVIKSPNFTRSGAKYNFDAYAYSVTCPSNGGGCYVSETVPMRGVGDPTYYTDYYGFAVKGPLGVQNLYCNKSIYSPKCPWWIDTALHGAYTKTYGATPAATNARTAQEAAASEAGKRISQPEDKMQTIAEDHKLSKEEMSSIASPHVQINGDNMYYVSSYHSIGALAP